MKKNIYTTTVIIYFLLFLFQGCKTKEQNIVNVEIGNRSETGEIRALNGGTLSPVCNLKLLDLSEEFKELCIPLVRLHDAPWLNENVVDIHHIFRDFRLDPTDESNYDFRKTDEYIKTILKTGTEIIFRLGESIEHTDRQYYVNPPEDFTKWAEICCGIIRHYNQGWAKGFQYNIKYWEIWNEPDCRPKMWTGSDKQFLELFGLASKKIKNEFPDIMIGGPAFSNPFLLEEGKYKVNEFTDSFLLYCRKKSIPLDFFSWHSYSSDPLEIKKRAILVRNLLDEYGFNDVESHMNEWNYIPGEQWHLFQDPAYQGKERNKIYAEQSGPGGASFIANVLMLLQDSPVDVANYYTTTAGLFGIFSEYGVPHKSYYAFKAFAELLKTPLRLETNYNTSDSIVVCSGINEEGSKLTILASNFSGLNKKMHFRITEKCMEGQMKAEVYIIDESHNLEKINTHSFTSNKKGFSEILPAPSVLLIVCEKNVINE